MTIQKFYVVWQIIWRRNEVTLAIAATLLVKDQDGLDAHSLACTSSPSPFSEGCIRVNHLGQDERNSGQLHTELSMFETFHQTIEQLHRVQLELLGRVHLVPN